MKINAIPGIVSIFTFASKIGISIAEGADKGFLAKGTRSFLKAHRDFPFVLSSFMPFPRYIANQMQFLYEHAPVIGFMGLENIGKKKGWKAETFKMSGEAFRKKLAQQSAGVAMMATAYKWREMQGDSTYWYEFKDDQGNYVDGKAIYGPFAPFMLAKECSKGMIEAGHGVILNVGSSSAYGAAPNTSIYCATKHALLGVSRAFQMELRSKGIRTTYVAPGSIQTEMGEQLLTQDYSTFIEPEELAEFLVSIILQEKNMIINEVSINRMIYK